MSCTNCGAFGEYRKLCNYNVCESCTSPPLGGFSFACSPGLGCHEVNQPPNHQQGRYSNYKACAEQCNQHSNAFSFACSPGIGCHKVNQPPNHQQGLYSNIKACESNCAALGRSYDCVTVGGYGGTHGMCVMKHGPSGQFKDIGSCQKFCQRRN